MPSSMTRATQLWTLIVEELDIAPSLYEKAAARHKSLGEWLCRPGSMLAPFDPHVSAQGSFRHGTVNKPVEVNAEYDLDHVVVLREMTVRTLTQAQLMERFGRELRGYADAHGMQAPVAKRRCWRLKYRDDVAFHLDSLPCVPAERGLYLALRARGIDEPFAQRAVAITDDRHAQYRVVTDSWLTSNPRGFARWFEGRAVIGRRPVETAIRAGTVEPVPTYRWKTPLQRAVQILKRHRDVMFRAHPELAPISMIITNLAARAYGGERDLGEALSGIVRGMGPMVNPTAPRVPNPTHPDEDYADKWRENPQLERQFWAWLEQVKADVLHFSDPLVTMDGARIAQCFGVHPRPEILQRLRVGTPVLISTASSAGPIRVNSGPRPWGSSVSGAHNPNANGPASC
jgi:hypothetical protein